MPSRSTAFVWFAAPPLRSQTWQSRPCIALTWKEDVLIAFLHCRSLGSKLLQGTQTLCLIRTICLQEACHGRQSRTGHWNSLRRISLLISCKIGSLALRISIFFRRGLEWIGLCQGILGLLKRIEIGGIKKSLFGSMIVQTETKVPRCFFELECFDIYGLFKLGSSSQSLLLKL